MKYLSLCFALAATTAVSAQTPSPKGGDKIVPEAITLTGCVAAGTEANTYMLSNVARSDKPGSNDTTAFYWLDSASKLKPHVGHKVEIKGRLDDDVDKMTTKTKDGKVEVKADNKKVEVAAGTAAGNAAGTSGVKRPSYKVKVESVNHVSPTCAQS